MYGINNDTNGRWGVFATGTGTGESGAAAGHTHCVCGKDAGVSVNGHTHSEAVTFTAWDKTDSLPTAGTYYLTENVTITSTWQPADGTVLCLNGKTISMNAAGAAISVDKDKTFVLTDCEEAQGSITHGINSEENTKYTGRGMDVTGTFTMYGGSIRNNISRGLVIYGNANMYAGVIKENGGGVTIGSYQYSGDFNMYGGSIIRNRVNVNSATGAGVYIFKGTFEVSGNVQIIGNLNGKAVRNLFNYTEDPITIGEGGLGKDAKIGVFYDQTAGPDSITNENTTNYSNCFMSDDASYKIRYTSDNKIDVSQLLSQNGFNFSSESGTGSVTVSKDYGDAKFTQPINGVSNNDDITYSSNNPTVASVNETTGEVTIVGVGPAKIKAIKKNQDSTKRDFYTYYDLTVNKRSIEIPTGAAKTYNGQVQKCYENNAEYNKYVTFVGDGQTEANEAGYDVTAVLKDKENTQWSDGTTDDKTFKFVINKAEGSVTAPAAVNNLVYNGSEQSLVTAGSGTGTMKYSLDGTNYSADVPKGKEAKTYTVYYKVEGDSNYKDIAAAGINVKVEKAPVTVTADNKTINTGGTLPANSYTAEGLFGSDTLGDAIYTYKDAEGKAVAADAINLNKAGTYTIEVSGLSNNNYDITYATGTLTINKKSSGGTYKPPVQKPSITAGEGFKAELSSDGTKATITVEEGYEIVDVLVNGISKGKVTEITGLKTGDTIEVKTEKKQTEPVKPADNKRIIKGVKNTEIELETTVNKDGNIVIKWKKSKGYRVDSFEILRAVKKNGKYSKIYTTKSGKASRIVNAKNLKDGKRYYYKVRGVRTIDGKKYYTEWSNVESEKVNK